MNMDHKNVSKLLKKINRLYELVNAIGEASNTEKDLLKAYVIDLYDAVTTSDIADEKDLEEAEMRKKLKKQRKLEKKLQKKSKKEKPKQETKVKQTDVPSPSTSVSAEPQKKTEPVKIKAEATPKVNSALTDLFEMDSGNDVSDKLAQTPIADLTKAMSINERIFTQNELFGGNQEEMNNILTALNGLGSFDEAKDVLIRSVANKYGWGESAKHKKAKTFIKLVKRRFNK